MAEHSAGFRIYARTDQFERDMARMKSTANDAASSIGKRFQAGDIAKAFASGLGIGSALSVIKTLQSAIIDSIEHSGKLAEIWGEIAKNARAASEAIGLVGKNEIQSMVVLQQRYADLVKKRDGLLNEKGARSFASGFVQRGSAVDALFGFSRKEEITRHERIRDINEEIGEIKVKILETEKKSTDATKKATEAALKDAVELGEKEYERTKALKELAKFEREARTEKLAGEKKLVALRTEETELQKKIATFEKEIKAGAYLTKTGAEDLLELKQDLADIQKRIKEETEATAKAEEKAAKAARATQEALAGIAGIRNGNVLGSASDSELQEALRRNQQAVTDAERAKLSIGDPFGAIGRNLEIARLQAEIQNIRAELNFRRDLRADFQLGGEALARRNFQGDALTFDRILQQFVQDNRTTQQVSAETNRLLQQVVNGTRTLPVAVVNRSPIAGTGNG